MAIKDEFLNRNYQVDDELELKVGPRVFVGHIKALSEDTITIVNKDGKETTIII